MSASNLPSCVASARRLLAAVAVFAFVPGAGQAAAPGITGTSFSLAASPAYVTQPDGALIYSWGYGCAAPPPTSAYMPSVFGSIGFCPTMQMPGPTLIVTEGATVTVTLTNNLPTGAGNTSIIFAGIPTTASGGARGLLAQEAALGGSVTY